MAFCEHIDRKGSFFHCIRRPCEVLDCICRQITEIF